MYDVVKEKPLVYYNPDLYNLMQQAHTFDRSVRITNFYEKIDDFNDKPVLTLGEQSRVFIQQGQYHLNMLREL